MFRKETEEGVSPVVGVILMVAITVILAAIIATFVLDLGGTVSQNPQAGVSFDQDAEENEVDVQIVSMENADSVSISDVSGGADDADFDKQEVGGVATVSGSGGDKGKITVTATLEGKTQVIQNFDYEFNE